MADPAPAFQPDIVGAMRLMIGAIIHLGQAVETNGTVLPSGGLHAGHVAAAQHKLAMASELLTDPNVPEPEAESPDPQPDDGAVKPADLPPATPPEPDAPPAPEEAPANA